MVNDAIHIDEKDNEVWRRFVKSMAIDESQCGDIDMRRYIDDLEECRCVNGACLLYGHE